MAEEDSIIGNPFSRRKMREDRRKKLERESRLAAAAAKEESVDKFAEHMKSKEESFKAKVLSDAKDPFAPQRNANVSSFTGNSTAGPNLIADKDKNRDRDRDKNKDNGRDNGRSRNDDDDDDSFVRKLTKRDR
jgi:hypothetical protein